MNFIALVFFGGIAVAGLAGCGGKVVLAGSGGSATTTTSGAGGSAICGGGEGACPAGTYCDFGDGACGAADGIGDCAPIPASCPVVPGPMSCGCDGKTYPSACAAAQAGVSLSAEALCGGTFACGYVACQLSSEYCLYAPDIQMPSAPVWSCVPLPASCGAPADCDCLSGVCGSCTGDGAAGITKSCPGLG